MHSDFFVSLSHACFETREKTNNNTILYHTIMAATKPNTTLKYKTGRLPYHFIILGYLLLALGIWRISLYDWAGIAYFLLAVIFLFFRSGLIIDTRHKKMMIYSGIFFIRFGKYLDISTAKQLLIEERQESSAIHVQSISRTDSKTVYRLFIILQEEQIELLAGERKDILKMSKQISEGLCLDIIDRTDSESV
jgi:hypothetical protein